MCLSSAHSDAVRACAALCAYATASTTLPSASPLQIRVPGLLSAATLSSTPRAVLPASTLHRHVPPLSVVSPHASQFTLGAHVPTCRRPLLQQPTLRRRSVCRRGLLLAWTYAHLAHRIATERWSGSRRKRKSADYHAPPPISARLTRWPPAPPRSRAAASLLSIPEPGPCASPTCFHALERRSVHRRTRHRCCPPPTLVVLASRHAPFARMI